jgi:hypothetical protein
MTVREVWLDVAQSQVINRIQGNDFPEQLISLT